MLVVCRAAVSLSRVAQFQSSTPKCIPTKLPMCALVTSKVPLAPMGRFLTRSPRLTLAQLRPCFGQFQDVLAAEPEIFPSPMGDSRFARCLQGGGVFVNGGTVTLSSCTINGNTANAVRAHLQKFPWPDVKVADVLAPTHACTTANAPVNNSS